MGDIMLIHGIPVKFKLNYVVTTGLSFLISILLGVFLGYWKTGTLLAWTLLFPTGLIYVKFFFLLTVPLICMEVVCGTVRHLQMRRHAALRGRLWSFNTFNDLGAAVLGIVGGLLIGFSGVPVFRAATVDFASMTLRTFFPALLLLSVVVGFGVDKAGEEGETARRFFQSMSGVLCCAGEVLMKFLPVGVFFLVCPVVARHGVSVMLLPLKLILFTIFFGLFYAFLVCRYFLYRCGKDCPGHFFRYFKPVLLQAFSNSYSKMFEENAVRSLQRMGVGYAKGQEEFDFGRLFGSTGTVLYCTVACIAVAQYSGLGSGLELSLHAVIGIFLWVLLISQTNPDFPGAGLFCALAVIMVTGLRAEAAVLLVICEWALSGIRSVVDVAFAGTGAYLADKLGWDKEIKGDG